ncbi:MAG: hypothetical protein CEN88_472, partial [Candidatus Berkelbacteria bacterium Licking1014_2]
QAAVSFDPIATSDLAIELSHRNFPDKKIIVTVNQISGQVNLTKN